MAKLTLNDVDSLTNEASAKSTINNNSAATEAALENTLSRDGTAPNQMLAPLDMNSFRILNTPAPIGANDVVRLSDLLAFTSGGTVYALPPGGFTGQFLRKTSNLDYAVAWANTGAQPVFDITDPAYGASTGSGNNGPAINLALAAASAAGGGVVYVPTGNFNFSTTINLQYDNVIITGNGVSSVLTYTGTTVGIQLSNGLDNVLVKDLKISSASTTNTLMSTKATNSSVVFSGVMFIGGGYNVEITSQGASQGSYDLNFVNGCIFANAAIISVWVHPTAVAFAQALFFRNCQWYGFKQAVNITSGSGIYFSQCHIERHTGVTTSPVHVDTSNKVVFDTCYLEDNANIPFFEIGSSVNNFVLRDNYIVANVDAGTNLAAGVLKCNAAATNLVFIGNFFGAYGTITSLIDLAASTVFARGNTMSATATFGWASTGTSAGVNIDGTDYSTAAFGTNQQVGVARMAVDASNASKTGTGTTIVMSASPALTGTPTAPTAAVDTNTTQLATTAMVVGQASAVTPQPNGTAAIGTSLRYARADHVHAAVYKMVMGFASVNTSVGGSTSYFTNNLSGIQSTQIPVAMTGTIKNMYFVASGGLPGAGQTYTFTLFKNGVATAITAQITNSSTVVSGSATASDLTHTVSVTAGDMITVQVVSSATAATNNYAAGFEIDIP